MAGVKPAHNAKPEAKLVEKDGTLTAEGKIMLDALAAVIERTGGVMFGPMRLPSFAKAALPPATNIAGALIYVTDDVGGAVPAFSDGSAWRRVTDRNVIS